MNIQRRMNTVWHNTPNTDIVRQRLEHRPSKGTDALIVTDFTRTTRLAQKEQTLIDCFIWRRKAACTFLARAGV